MPDEEMKFMIEDAQLIFRNFSGKESQYNRAGNREFSVILDEQTAKQMKADGWHVRALDSREEGEPDTPYITIAVNFQNRPPRVIMLTSTSRTPLNEDSIEILDWTDIKQVDLIANPYHWTVGEKSGIKAYLKSMYVTIEEDELDRKYAVQEEE
jgi:hypothetical protein